MAKVELAEDWQLSQFWYDTETCVGLEKMVKGALGNCGGKVCCISSPTLMKHLLAKKAIPEDDLILLEFDKRFESFKKFHFWDFNEPLKLDPELKGTIDVVIADPPFLSEGNFELCLKFELSLEYLNFFLKFKLFF